MGLLQSYLKRRFTVQETTKLTALFDGEHQECGIILLSGWSRRIFLQRRACVANIRDVGGYGPYAGYFYCYASPTPDYRHHLGWIIYLIFNNNFSIATHTVAVWLTVSIAVFRYIVVCGRHALGARLCSRQRAKLAIVAVVPSRESELEKASRRNDPASVECDVHVHPCLNPVDSSSPWSREWPEERE